MTTPKPRILFTEDHEDTREMVVLFLQSDYEVATATNVVETLRLAQSGDYNLFIFDSLLPDGSGIDLCRSVREFNQHTPILFYSGVAYEKDKRLALSSGAQDYLVKPVDISYLLETVNDLVAGEKSRGALANGLTAHRKVALRTNAMDESLSAR
jgi:DNA-binding response OmpR family regulator